MNATILAAITLADAGPSWTEQGPAMKVFAELCPEDGQHMTHCRALKMLADEVRRLESLLSNYEKGPSC